LNGGGGLNQLRETIEDLVGKKGGEFRNLTYKKPFEGGDQEMSLSKEFRVGVDDFQIMPDR
jgi:hypothetical protein